MPRTSKTSEATRTTGARKSRASAGAAKIDKSQAEKFLAGVPEEYAFWCHDGRVFRDIRDLRDALNSMSDQGFSYHSNESKKDFSNWVRNVIGDETLAKDLEAASSREQAARIVEERFSLLSSKAG